MHKKLLVSLMAVLVAFGLTGCVKTPKLENGKEIVAEVDGKQVTAEDLYEELKKESGTDTLINMIDEFIISKELTDTSNEEALAKAYVKQMKEYYESAGQNWSEVLASAGYTEDSLIKAYINNYAKDTIAKNYYKNSITDEQIQKYYDEEIIGDITAKHILIAVDSSETATDAEKKAAEKAALNKAKEVITKLNNGGSFTELAKEYSADKNASEGGTLAPFNKQSNYSEEFINAAVKLKAGEYTKNPVKSEYGYHIILVESKAEKPSLESVKETIINTLSDEAINSNEKYLYTAWKKLREKYNLSIHDTVMDEKYKTAMTQY